MDRELSAQLDRIEAALTTLTESITTYNPSVSAAEDLCKADASFTLGLDKLVRHQSNHAQLLRLRHTASRLDTQIKDTVGRLAGARKQLLEQPWTEPILPISARPEDENTADEATMADRPVREDGARKVPMAELLLYAQKIAKTSLPPNYRQEFDVPVRPAVVKTPTTTTMADETQRDDDEQMQETQVTEPASSSANGVNSSTNGAPQEGKQEDATMNPQASEGTKKEDGIINNEEEDRGAAYAKLAPQSKAWLDELKNLPFVPWPNEDLIKGGALAGLQRAVERGEDPWAGTAVAIVVAEDGVNGGLVDATMVDEETNGMVVEGGRVQQVARRAAPPAASAAAPALFGMYDPEAEDE